MDIYFLIEDDQPQRFYPCVIKQARFKIFFQLQYPQRKVFNLDENADLVVDQLSDR